MIEARLWLRETKGIIGEKQIKTNYRSLEMIKYLYDIGAKKVEVLVSVQESYTNIIVITLPDSNRLKFIITMWGSLMIPASTLELSDDEAKLTIWID